MRRLAAAVLLQAAKDVLAGRPCNGACRPADGVHFCRRDARRFLNSPWGRQLLEVVGLGQQAGSWCWEWQAEAINPAAGRHQAEGEQEKQFGQHSGAGAELEEWRPV